MSINEKNDVYQKKGILCEIHWENHVTCNLKGKYEISKSHNNNIIMKETENKNKKNQYSQPREI